MTCFWFKYCVVFEYFFIVGNQQNIPIMKVVSTETCLSGSFSVPIVATADAFSEQLFKERLEFF